jgi:hypothetical protein
MMVGPNHYIFVVKDHRCGGAVVDAFTIFEDRVRKRVWGLSRYAAHRRKLCKGDRVVFYVSSRSRNMVSLLVGRGVLDSQPYLISDVERRLCIALPAKYTHVVDLADVEVWPKPLPFRSVCSSLSFVKNKQSPYVYLQGGVVRISEGDYLTICNTAKLFMSSNSS